MMHQFQKLYKDKKEEHEATIQELKDEIAELDKHVKTLEVSLKEVFFSKNKLKCAIFLMKFRAPRQNAKTI